MFTKKFLVLIGVFIYIATVGGLLANELSLKKDIRELQARPIAVMPTKEIATPTASPTAVFTPTKSPVRIVSPKK